MNNKKGKTIRQLAEEIGVSKTAIRNKMTDEVKSKFSKTVSGIIYIDKDGENIIKHSFNNKTENQNFAESCGNNFSDSFYEISDVISILKLQLEVKDQQIEHMQNIINQLTSTLDSTTKALNNSQTLHAGTLQQNLLLDQSLEDPNENIILNKPKRKKFWSRLFNK